MGYVQLIKSTLQYSPQKHTFTMYDLRFLQHLYEKNENDLRLQHLIGLHFNRNYSVHEVPARDLKSSSLLCYSKSFSFSDIDSNEYNFFKSNCIKEGSLVENISFYDEDLSAQKINCIRNVLRNVKFIELKNVTIDGDFYENFLKMCKNLNHLRLNSLPDERWLYQLYPNLNRLELVTHGRKVNELENLLRNHQIQRFGIDAASFRRNLDVIVASGATFAALAIDMTGFRREKEGALFDELNRLYEQHVFDRLHLQIKKPVRESLQRLQGLKSLYIWNKSFEDDEDAYLLPELEELGFMTSDIDLDMEALAIGLERLERLHFSEADIEDVLPFIQNSPKLKTIKVTTLHLDTEPIDVATFNGLREQLEGACKVTLYIGDHIYWEVKRSMEIDFPLISLERGSSYDPQHYFVERYH